MDELNNEVDDLLKWAEEVSIKTEILTKQNCSIPKVLALFGIEKNKLRNGTEKEKNERAKVKVANQLLNR